MKKSTQWLLFYDYYFMIIILWLLFYDYYFMTAAEFMFYFQSFVIQLLIRLSPRAGKSGWWNQERETNNQAIERAWIIAK